MAAAVQQRGFGKPTAAARRIRGRATPPAARLWGRSGKRDRSLAVFCIATGVHNLTVQNRPGLHHQARRSDLAENSPRRLDGDFLTRFDVTPYGTSDHHAPGGNVALDSPQFLDDYVVAGQLDGSLYFAIDIQVVPPGYFALDTGLGTDHCGRWPLPRMHELNDSRKRIGGGLDGSRRTSVRTVSRPERICARVSHRSVDGSECANP